MPVGPSHGSRGGSSFSGGGSHRSSNSSSSNSSSSSFLGAMIGGMIASTFSNKRRERFHTRYGYYPDEKDFQSVPQRRQPTALLVLSIITIFFIVSTFIFRAGFIGNQKSYTQTIEIMESDWTEYHEIIQKAEAGESGYHLVDARFGSTKYEYYEDNPTSIGAYLDFTKDGISYYFIVYEYAEDPTTAYEDIDIATNTFKGTTYTQFSASQVQDKGGKIKIAYQELADGSRVSINYDYKLQTCAEYKYYVESRNNAKNGANGCIVALVIEFVALALFIFFYIKQFKKYLALCAQDDELIFKKKQAEVDVIQSEANNKNKFCKYCGSKIDPNTNTCSSCGAKVSNN